MYFKESKLKPSVAIIELSVNPIKIATPPIGGIVVLWIFLSSKGSNRCLARAILRICGIVINTKTKLIINALDTRTKFIVLIW
jgi:hypothetical protein